jgi:hypothetical protein
MGNRTAGAQNRPSDFSYRFDEGELDRKAIRAKPRKVLPDDGRWNQLKVTVSGDQSRQAATSGGFLFRTQETECFDLSHLRSCAPAASANDKSRIYETIHSHKIFWRH